MFVTVTDSNRILNVDIVNLFYNKVVVVNNVGFVQTFGVVTMRLDMQESGGPIPVRSSASTQAQSSTTSTMGTLSIIKPGTTNTSAEYGIEVEVHNLLVIDQHTFEGTKDM